MTARKGGIGRRNGKKRSCNQNKINAFSATTSTCKAMQAFQQPEKEKTVIKALKQVIVTIQDKKYICYRSCPNLKKVSLTYEGHKVLCYPTMIEKDLIEIHFNTLEHNYLLKKNLARTNKYMRKQQRKEILKTKSTNGLTKKMNKQIDDISNKLRMSRESVFHSKTVITKRK